MQKNILIIQANPDNDTFSGLVADSYQQGADEGGHTVVRVNLGDLKFDPILHKGYKEIQPLEQDLIDLQVRIKEADHVVIVYPNWWCTMPALLKGLFDRIWLPGFAFNFDKQTGKLIQHLKGKTARTIIVMGTHSPFRTWWRFGDYTNEIQYGILEFAGFKTKVTPIGPTNKATDKARTKWLKEVSKLGFKGI
jgi:NAD(P)H dehydrogenase (quinone)